MGLRMFDENDGWDAMRGSVGFTVGMLRASKTHAALAKPLRSALGQWDAHDQVLRDAAAAEVDANASVAWEDGVLDGAVQEHARQLLDDCGGDRERPAFKAYYPGAPSDLTDQALEAQIGAMKHFVEAAKAHPPSKSLASRNAKVQAAMTAGSAAVAQREKAALGVMRGSMATKGWREGVNKARRTVHAALVQWAADNDAPRDYAERFFPAARRAVKGKGGGGGEGGGEPKPG